MVPIYDPFVSTDSDKLKENINQLISGYNCLCSVLDGFRETIPGEFFAQAKREVLDSGNASLASMLYMAIEEMGVTISNLREDNKELEDRLDSLSNTEQEKRIRELEKEVKQLKSQLESVESVIEKASKILNYKAY